MLLTFYYIHSSPYENRCQHLHDPLVMRGYGDDCEGIIVPGHCTKATKDGSPVDCQYHHNINSITQVNSLIAPAVWSNCSPTISKASAFERTYSMVCNATGLLPLPGGHSTCTKSNTNMSYSDSVKLNSPANTVFDELQKLCIVLRLLDMDEDVRESFIYRPDHCEFSCLDVLYVDHIISHTPRALAGPILI